jgi:hypothetical protein
MEMMLAIFFVGYLAIAVAGLVFAFWWSKENMYGWIKTSAMVFSLQFVIYAIPFGGITIGVIKKNRLCKEYGGTKIFRVVENVDGFMRHSVRQGQVPYTTHGFAFYEVKTRKGEIYRYTRSPHGHVVEDKIEQVKSRYVAQQLADREFGEDHRLRVFAVLDTRNNEILGSYGRIEYRGSGGVGSSVCPAGPPFDYNGFIKSILRVPGN